MGTHPSACVAALIHGVAIGVARQCEPLAHMPLRLFQQRCRGTRPRTSRSPVDGQEYAPTLAMAQLSNTNWGRVLSNRTAELLHANKPIEIHILGGSVSVAAYVMTGAFKKRGEWHPDNPLVGTSMRHGNSNSENAWPAMVEAALSGCLGAGMARVINHAERAVGTDVWVDRMASNSVNLSSADVILIEEASNDAEQYTVQAAGGGGGKSGFTGESSGRGLY